MEGNYATNKNYYGWRIGVLTILSLIMCGPCLAQRAPKSEKQQQIRELPQKTEQYETTFYKSGTLNIEAYLYKPQGNGPFPLVIYNHGSRDGSERTEVPCKYIAAVLQANGFAVLVPERRGYGKSDGQTYGEEVGGDRGDRMMQRFHEEATDVLAGLDYLKNAAGAGSRIERRTATAATHLIDFNRVVIMGWSHGGVVSLLAASERHEFIALVNQAGGSLTWNSSPTLQRELPAVAKRIKVPALCMDAENDATTNSVKTVGLAIKASGEPEQTIIYPAFTPTSNPSDVAPGHLIFAQGVSIWQDDLFKFLKRL